MYYGFCLHTAPLLRLSCFLRGLCGLLPCSILSLSLPLPLHELLPLRWRIIRLSVVEEREGRIEEVRVLAVAIVAHVHADLVDLALGLVATPLCTVAFEAVERRRKELPHLRSLASGLDRADNLRSGC